MGAWNLPTLPSPQPYPVAKLHPYYQCLSPEPDYDYPGRRTNTREQRHHQARQDELHALVDEAFKTISRYSPPRHLKQPASFAPKVYVPIADYPGVNSIGPILGPHGSSLKALNDKAGASRHDLRFWRVSPPHRIDAASAEGRQAANMGIKQLFQIIKEEAPDSIKEGEIKNHFGRKVAIVSRMTRPC